ncbi:MAG: hypothetical protein ACHQUC_09260 [Chlamydiales bacterium]
MDELGNMTDKERQELQDRSNNEYCLCGHLKKEHQKFMADNAMFVGCMHSGCICRNFDFWRDQVVDPPGYDKLPDADKQRTISFALLEGENKGLRHLVENKNLEITSLQIKLKEANEDAAFLYNVVARSVKADSDIGVLIEDEEFAMKKHIDRIKRNRT